MSNPDGTKRVQPDELTKEIKAKGYMSIVGTFLWLSRNCFPEISQGVSQLCAVISMPSQEALNVRVIGPERTGNFLQFSSLYTM